MNWLSLQGNGPQKIPPGPPIRVLLSIVRAKASGVLQFQHDKITRQLHFHNGAPIGGGSNLKSELPLFFLQRQGEISEDGVQTYLQSQGPSKAAHWPTLLQTFSLPLSRQHHLQHRYALSVFENLMTQRSAPAVFAIRESPHPVPPPEPRWLLTLAPTLSKAYFCQAFPEFLPSCGLKLLEPPGDSEHRLSLTPEEKGLLVAIENNARVEELWVASFLGEDRITAYLFLLSALGCLDIQGEDDAQREALIKNLSPDQRQKRDKILQDLRQGDSRSWYEWIGCAADSSLSDLKRIAQERLDEVASAEVESLFIASEKPLWATYVEHIKTAYMTLTDPQKRLAYHQRIAHQGQAQAPRATPNDLASIEGLLSGGNMEAALEKLTQLLAQDPTSRTLRSYLDAFEEGRFTLMRTLLAHEKTLNPYDWLAIEPNAPLTKIKSAYRSLSKIYHPDRYVTFDPERHRLATLFYKRLNMAWSTLKDDQAREKVNSSILRIDGHEPTQSGDSQPKTPYGIKFLRLAEEAYKLGQIEAAKKHLKMGQQSEPTCSTFERRLKEWA